MVDLAFFNRLGNSSNAVWNAIEPAIDVPNRVHAGYYGGEDYASAYHNPPVMKVSPDLDQVSVGYVGDPDLSRAYINPPSDNQVASSSSSRKPIGSDNDSFIHSGDPTVSNELLQDIAELSDAKYLAMDAGMGYLQYKKAGLLFQSLSTSENPLSQANVDVWKNSGVSDMAKALLEYAQQNTKSLPIPAQFQRKQGSGKRKPIDMSGVSSELRMDVAAVQGAFDRCYSAVQRHMQLVSSVDELKSQLGGKSTYKDLSRIVHKIVSENPVKKLKMFEGFVDAKAS